MNRLQSYFFTGLAVLLLFNPLSAANHGHEHEQHAAHVHGEARLLVAVEEKTVEMEFTSPAMNLLGFEHRPKTEEQQKQLQNVIEKLKQAELLFSLPAAANCRLTAVEVESPYDQQSGDDVEHTDFSAFYHYSCPGTRQVKMLMVKLFEQFPLTETVEVQTVSSRGQKKADLQAEDNIVDL